jgi:hypothetical protein
LLCSSLDFLGLVFVYSNHAKPPSPVPKDSALVVSVAETGEGHKNKMDIVSAHSQLKERVPTLPASTPTTP